MWLQRVGHNLATEQQQWQILSKVSMKNLDGVKEAEQGHLVLPRWEIRRKEQVCVHKPQISWWTLEGQSCYSYSYLRWYEFSSVSTQHIVIQYLVAYSLWS